MNKKINRTDIQNGIASKIRVQNSDADKRLQRVLTTDPGTGVMRHVDAGYDKAKRIAKERKVNVGIVEGL